MSLERAPRRHIFVCTADFTGSCARAGSKDLFKALHRQVRDAGLRAEVSITSTGCTGGCERGPNVIVYPEGVWYGGLHAEDAERLVREHVVGGRLLADKVRSDRHPDGVAAPPMAAGRVVDALGREWPTLQRGTPVRVLGDEAAAAVALLGVPVDPASRYLIADAGELANHAIDAFAVALYPPATLFNRQGNLGMVGRACGEEERAAALNGEVERRLARLKELLPADAERLRVVFHSRSGESTGHWGPIGTVICFSGGKNVAAQALKLTALQPVAWSELAALDPQVVFTDDPERVGPRVAPVPVLRLPEARPSIGVIDAIEAAARLLYPDLFPPELP